MINEQLIYILALRQLKGVGDKLAQNIILSFNQPSEIFLASKDRLLGIEGVGKILYNEIKNFNNWSRIEDQIKKINNYGFKILTFLEKEYPRNLLNIYNPPTVIYCFGNIKEQDNSSISIVGSRNGNKYGKSVTKQISEGLVKNGITIISGMERGIDTFAHQEAIRSGGRTIAVLGSGLNEVYPPENIKLYKQISENGAVISEFPLGVRPEANNFPKRNRVISGLSLGVVIVQASKKSGSLITADYALEQNREVFAVPGNIDSKLSEGTNILIKKGAKLVQNVEDILDEFKCFGNQKVKMSTKNNSDISRLTKDEIKVLELLSSRAHYFDEIVGSLRIDNGRIFKLLLNMEIKGLIYNLPGNLYQAR